MKRRKFLSLIGAAAAAPLAPSFAAGSAAPLYSRTAFSRAVMHARLKPHVSARGIAYRLKVSVPQAEAMIAEMASKGMVQPVLNGGGVHVRAMSSIVKPQAWGAGDAARRARSETATEGRAELTRAKPRAQASMMDHLCQMCRDYGMPLSPRALAMQGGFA